MKQNRIRNRTFGGALLSTLAVLLAACGDGAVPVPIEEPKPSLNPPVVNSFTASSVEVSAGDSVELAWSITGADAATLKSESGSLPEHDVSPGDGKETIAGIMADETFTLTAFNQGVAAVGQVTVRLKTKATLAILSFAAVPDTIQLQQAVKFCFTVTPKEAEVQIFRPNGEIAPLAEAEAPAEEPAPAVEEEPELLAPGVAVSIASKSLNLPPPGQAAEAGGKIEAPSTESDVREGCTGEEYVTQESTYTLVASLPDGSRVESEATVKVTSALRVSDLYATQLGGSDQRITSLTVPGKVLLNWVIEGAYDAVTLTPGDVPVTDKTIAGKGSTEIEMKETTAYTITATKGEEQSSLSLTITLEAPKIESITLTADRTAIVKGEEVKLTVSAGGATIDAAGVKIYGPDGAPMAEGVLEALVKPAKTGAYYAELNGVKSGPVQIAVREWESVEKGVATAIGVDGEAVFLGFEQALAVRKVGKEYFAEFTVMRKNRRQPSASVAVDYVGAFKAAVSGEWLDSRFTGLKPYTVNIIAVNPVDAQQVVVGMSGAVFISTDGGKAFAIADAIPELKKGDGTHLSCKGRTQAGRKTSIDNDIGKLLQVCDLLFLPDGRLVVAYDNGVGYNANIAAHAKDRKNKSYAWQGIARNGKGGNALAGVVSHDLALDKEKNMLYVATDKGVYKSTDNAETFTDEGGLGKAALAVAVGADGTVWAGTKTGLYKLADGKWEVVKSFGGDEAQVKLCADGAPCVFSIVEDPSSPGTFYVGAGNGLHIIRNGVETATVVEDFGGKAETFGVAVRAIAISASEGDVNIYVGTANGVYVSHSVEHAEEGKTEEKKEEPAEEPKEAPKDRKANPNEIRLTQWEKRR